MPRLRLRTNVLEAGSGGWARCTTSGIGAAAWLGKREDRQFILLVALIVLTVGVARSLNLTVMVATLTLGLLARNLDYEHALMPLRLGHGGQLFFVILFVWAGASLEFGALGGAAAAAVAVLIAVRFLGKALALLVFGHFSGIRPGGAGRKERQFAGERRAPGPRPDAGRCPRRRGEGRGAT